MRILSNYSQLQSAFKSGEEVCVKGIDWVTRYIKPCRCHVVKVEPCVIRRVSTITYNSIVLPHHKFLVNPLPYPFSSVPLTSLLRLRMDELKPRHMVAVAPMAEVSNNPFYPNCGVIQDHVITFSPITGMTLIGARDTYDIALDEGDNYILGNSVRVL
jgi:hypothetical protein